VSERLDPPNRIAVRLPNWLGDTVMAVPALVAVRAAWPQARVLAAGPWASLLVHQELADVLADYPRAWRARLRAADTVSAFAPELAILLPNSLEAALAAWYWGARRRVGFAGGGRSQLLTDAVPMTAPRQHQIDEYLVLAERSGAAASTREPVLRPPDPDAEARAEARRLLQDVGVPSRAASRRIAVHLGAAYGSAKLWPLERVVEFCRLLVAEGATAILLGAPGDAPAAAAITASAPALSLVGRDRPALLPALLAEVDVLVAGDTGVAHLAAALGTSVVTLFGPTDPRLSAPRGRAVVVTHPVPCAPCFYRTCPIEHPCLRGVEPADVYKRAVALLEDPA
jgi:lipopolysaccharide heptosyltransferase II